jgi:threonine dehydrogenase-like Zn-dependent dehydrogenase
VRGVLLPGDRQALVAYFPEPHPGEGEVVVAMRAAAVCGSDLHSYRTSVADRAGGAGTIPGHEPSGVVVEVGPGVRRVKVGDRVSVYHFRGCGHCRRCVGGQIMWCADRRGYGGPIHGSDADYLLTDERNCLPLPDDLSFEVGALIACNTGTAYASLRKLNPSGRDTLVVFGLGPVGLNGVLIGRALGARVIGVDVSRFRRSMAEELGAEAALDPGAVDVAAEIRGRIGGDGADLAFETSGNPRAQASLVDVLGYGGTGVFVGFGAREPAINPSAFIGKQLTLMGSFVAPIEMYWEIVDFVRQHRLPLEKMITHRLPLSDAPRAFELADSAATGKVIFVWPR